jgi:putative MATE family efflux protein
MGTMGENRLLLTLSVPMMISMLVQALYNIVDSIFVARLSEEALTAVTLAFPIQNLMVSVSIGTGIGINALLSRNLGARDFEGASRAANVGVTLNLMSSLVFTLFGFFGCAFYFAVQIDNPLIVSEGAAYLFPICVFSLGAFGQMTYTRLLQATGKTTHSMVVQLVGVVINIILNPLLIFGIGIFPQMGVTGSAAATVIGQWCAALLGLYMNRRYNPEITLSLGGMRLRADVVRGIYSVGVPSIIMQTVASVMYYAMNQVVLVFSETAATAFGVYFKIQGFFFMPVFGLNNGLVPIIAYNYGAKRPARIKKTIKLAVVYAEAILALGFVVFQAIPDKLLLLFGARGDLLAIGVPTLRIISFSFLLAGFGIVSASVFQALGHGFFSMIVSLVRQLVILVPLAYLFSLSGVLNYVWLSYPAAELVATALAAWFLRRVYQQVIKPLGEGSPPAPPP